MPGHMYGLCLERANVLKDFIDKIYLQSKGEEGDIYLTDKMYSIRFEKEVSVIFNPFSLDVNEKRIISKLHSEMANIANQEWYIKIQEINAKIIGLIDDVSIRIPYPIDYVYEMDFLQILKAYTVRIDNQETELVNRIVNYVKLTHQILGIKVFVFVHFKDYFTIDEMEQMEETLMYEGVVVLLIESSIENISKLKWWVIDNDNCLIEI